MANGISPPNKILLDLLANSLFNANLEIDCEQATLKEIYDEAKAQTVVAFAFDALPKRFCEIDPTGYKKWQLIAFKSAQINIKQVQSNATLERMFKTAGIPICTIKGFASNYYYPKKHLRQMGDIDFIVPDNMLDEGKALLSENGFRCFDEEEIHDFHIGYSKNGDVYEMHKGITSFLDENGFIERYISDIFKHTQEVDYDGATLTIPDKFSHGLIMLLHMHRHMVDGGGVGLRHLCDWAVFVDSIANDEWIEIFQKKLTSIKLWRFAQALSKTSSVFLKINEKSWFSEISEELATQLLDDMIIGGNFGKKDNERYQEVAYLTQTEKDKNILVKYFKSYVKKVGLWKPFYKKHKWLLPFGMVAYLFRTSFLLIVGKKKMDFSKMHENTTKRNDLYSEIFELK